MEWSMKRRMMMAMILLLAGAPALAYQVTGPVVEATDSKIVIKKGKENWEIARDASTRVMGDIQPGAKVTVEYKMTATGIEVKNKAKRSRSKSKDK